VPTPREQLGRRLRDLRQGAGLSGDALATRAGLTQSKVSRVETGRSLPNLAELQAWARATKATEEELAELAGLVEQVATSATSWRILHRLGLAEKQRELAELEHEARRIQTFQPTMVPGLLQVAMYARSVISMSYQPGDVAEAVAARVARQSILYEESRQFDFLITEGALSWRPSGVDLRPQLDHLNSMATLPNVSINMVPLGEPGRMPLLHPFVIWELETETLVTAETYSAELSVTESRDVDRYREVWQRLSETAQPWRPGSWPTLTP
jgi:transcriptional regulator with XRE-family HTH domain